MLEGLKGKEVSIQMGGIFAENWQGKALEVGETWIKLQTKKKIVCINLAMIGSISTDSEL